MTIGCVAIATFELPLSPVGKVLLRQVKEHYWAGQDRRV
jgi:hypothetical protein